MKFQREAINHLVIRLVGKYTALRRAGRMNKDIAAAAGLLTVLSALQLASTENRKTIKGVGASVWGYLSYHVLNK